MNIVLVTHYFPPHKGGIENVALNQATILAKLGHKVTVVTSAIPNKTNSSPEQYKIIRVTAMNVLEEKFGVPYPLFSPRILFELRKAIRSADVVHAHGHVYITSVLAALLARYHRKPFVLTQHNTFIDYSSTILCLLQRFADATLGKFTIKRSNKVIAVSKATQDYVEAVNPADCAIHYNGVDLVRFHPVLDYESVRRRLSIPHDRIVCLCVRRVTFKNGIGTLLEAAALIQDIGEIMFLVCGDGADLEAAKMTVRSKDLKNVMLTGPVTDQELPSYYAASDIFILPSMTGEGFPLVVLEALASGLPVIATRSGGHVEVLEAYGCGRVVSPGSPIEIADLLRLTASSPDRLEKAVRVSRQVAEAEFSWNKNVNNLLAVFAEVLR